MLLLLLYMECVMWRTGNVANIVSAHESKRMPFLMQFPHAYTTQMLWGGRFERRKRKKKKEKKRNSLTGLGHQVMWTLPKAKVLAVEWRTNIWCTACYGALGNHQQHPPKVLLGLASSHPSFPHLQPAILALPRGETISKFMKPQPSFPTSVRGHH